MPTKVSKLVNPVFEWSWLHPRLWGTWLILGVLWLIVLLPYPLLLLIGKLIGRFFLLIGKKRRRVTQVNLKLCFPELSDAEREKILKKSFESAAMTILEMGMAWWWPEWRLRKKVQLVGREHVDNLDGQGAVLLGMHFTTLDIAGAGLSLYLPYGAMYRPHKNPVFNFVQFRGRSRSIANYEQEEAVIFPRKDLRTMIRLLRKGMLVWYAPDQDYGAEHSIFAPFFGVPAATITATAKLVSMSHAKVLPYTHERLSGNAGYRITIHPPLENYPSGDELEDATTINKLLEEKIRLKPEQYLWAHRRFKTRPPGESSIYK